MLAGVDETDGSCRGGGAKGEQLEEGGEGGVRGDCERNCWVDGLVGGWKCEGEEGVLSPESSLMNIWKFSEGVEDVEDVEALDEERERTILAVAVGVCALIGKSYQICSLVMVMVSRVGSS